MKLFIETVSKERFQRYMAMAANDEFNASKLYTVNALIAESFYIPMQGIEVCLRNRIHTVLQSRYGYYWFDTPNLLKNSSGIEQIAEAKIRIINEKIKEDDPLSESRIIAALPFGFWTSFFNHDYEDLWRSELHKIILGNKSGVTRKTFSGRLHLIRKIRNRIAHHECIIDDDILHIYNAIDELTGLLSQQAQFWIHNNSRFL